ncbi:926_t:CDS:2 [Ambispora gerdemannii]|uniref:926_t:CDS:1 n=1 Tax=Ambispora gerdemannii TaxID=144530 RepID=A0A9N8VSY7_9GLOM|nr:926_t:CDS:2 [Ambispora gerdemannii]
MTTVKRRTTINSVVSNQDTVHLYLKIPDNEVAELSCNWSWYERYDTSSDNEEVSNEAEKTFSESEESVVKPPRKRTGVVIMRTTHQQ